MTKKIWILMLFSAVAHATDFTGSWTGEGVMTQVGIGVEKKTVPCRKIEITIQHTTHELVTQKYRAFCGQVQPDWGPDRMEIRGTQVFQYDEQVGTLEGDTLLTTVADSGVQYAYNLRLKTPPPKKLGILESYYGVRNAIGTIVIEGNLKKVH